MELLREWAEVAQILGLPYLLTWSHFEYWQVRRLVSLQFPSCSHIPIYLKAVDHEDPSEVDEYCRLIWQQITENVIEPSEIHD